MAAFCVLTGPSVLLHPASSVVGVNPSSDYQIMAWSLEWWPWAIGHGVNPFHTALLWPPSGFSTFWMTTIPVPALLALPITLTAGPLVAYNVLIILTVPLAAVSAFLLCWELTERVLPSVLGSLAFGLSPYMLGHTLSDHLDLTFIFPVPLLALVIVRYMRAKTSKRRAVIACTLLLLVQLGASFELFIDLTLMLAVGVVLALLGRRAFLRAAELVGLAYAACLPILVAIAVAALRAPHAALRYNPRDFATDALNVLVPTPTALAGTAHAAQSVSEHFVGNVGEQDGYIGIPLLVVALLAVRKEWRRGAWLAGGLLVAALFLSFGPQLTANGRPLFALPFAVQRLPLLHDLLPARMSLFAALIAACLGAVWLARQRHAAVRIAVSLLIVFSLLPNFFPKARVVRAWAISEAFGWSTRHIPDGNWVRLVEPGTTILVFPPGDRSAASYWAAVSRMRFALAAPATPFAPPKIAAEPVVRALVNNAPPMLAGARLRTFLIADHVSAVVVARHTLKTWRRAVALATAAKPVPIGRGMQFYDVSPSLRPLELRSKIVHSSVMHSLLISTESPIGVAAWLHFDGRRAHLWAQLRRGTNPIGRPVTLSSRSGDADKPAVSADGHAHAVVAFTESQDGRESLRVATLAKTRWLVTTLESLTQPIWSPHVAITSAGTAVATWVDERDPIRSLRASAFVHGRWQKPITLESGDGLAWLTLGIGDGDVAVTAWTDGFGTESRVRAALYDNGRWSRARTVAQTLDTFGVVTFTGDDATRLRWLRWSLTGKVDGHFSACREGTRWLAQGAHSAPR